MSDVFRFALPSEIFSWPSTSCLIAGAPFVGITGCKYDVKRERKLVYGMNRAGKPLGRTSGKFTPGVLQLTMLRASYDVLTTLLTPFGLGSYGDAKTPGQKGFPIVFKYEEPLDPAGIGIVSFSDCAIDGESDDQSEGVDELLTVVDLSFLDMTRNGKRLYSLQRGIGL